MDLSGRNRQRQALEDFTASDRDVQVFDIQHNDFNPD
jgi:hypothetical protein